MIDYHAANVAWRRYRTALTRAINRRDHAKILGVVADFYAYYDANGWPLPDDWRRFDEAKRQAERALAQQEAQ